MLLFTVNERWTAWHRATYVGNPDVLQKLWNWAEKNKQQRREIICFQSRTMRESPSETWLQRMVHKRFPETMVLGYRETNREKINNK